MKTDRFPVSLRTAAFVLAGSLLLIAAGRPAAGQSISLRFKIPAIGREDSSKKLAVALTQQVEKVRERFAANRSALRTVQAPGGRPAYLRKEVDALIARTGDDLDQAIARARESGMEPLRAWAGEEILRIQGELAAQPSQTAAASFGLFAPRSAGVVFASLRRASLPRLASTAGPKQETVGAETSNRLLDQAGEMIGRLLLLAERNDLEVKLWVGSTPARKAMFSFWPQGKIEGSTPEPAIIRTDGKRDHVLRGLYAYRAAWTQGQVTELVQYPNPPGAPASQLRSERLDLVNGSSFFCCRFNEQFCQHVDDEKECRP